MKRLLALIAPAILATSAAAQAITERISDPHAFQTAASSRGAGGLIVGLVLVALSIALYFAPSIVASRRGVKNTAGVILLNVLLGWTGLGWIAALIWAFSGETTTEASSKQIDYQRLAASLRTTAPPPPPRA